MKVVAKANNDLISFCACPHQTIATQGQADCPWCGCGWLFTCSECRLAFTYGEVVESDLSEEAIGRRLLSISKTVSSKDAIAAYEWLEYELEPLSVSDIVVYLDGGIRRVSDAVAFNGWFARHEFAQLPHRGAHTRKDLDFVFGNREYWLERELPERRP